MDLIIFPNQLYADHPAFNVAEPNKIVLIEDGLFFGDDRYPCRFHKQKLWLHRASMKRYEKRMVDQGKETVYLDYRAGFCIGDHLKQFIRAHKTCSFVVVQPTDFILQLRLQRACQNLGISIDYLDDPGFINRPHENREYRAGKNRWFMADFYKWQRSRLDVLMADGKPLGGRWSFDESNRKKVPKQMLTAIPELPNIETDEFDSEAIQYVERTFADNLGSLRQIYFPTSHKAAKKWLQQFLLYRFESFGDYEDAIVKGESWLWHSVLTPMLNIGLLTPGEIVAATLTFAESHQIPINSLEGFIRQIVGWREFIRATYQELGVTMRTTNHWNHRRKMPACFYNGTTGIEPVDDTIQRVLQTGYCHHIERLMVLGGFMFLCEIDPDDIYKWFMEMFVDSYDWVMVPNVYAMSQHADGGLITTKPYFSGSSYVRKMSHYKAGPWCDIWDGLYWRWISVHADELAKNPRWSMMCGVAKKMAVAKRQTHIQNAEDFFKKLKTSPSLS